MCRTAWPIPRKRTERARTRSRHHGKCIAPPRQMHRDTTANASRPCGAPTGGGRAAGGGFCRSARNGRERVRDTTANASRHHGECIATPRRMHRAPAVRSYKGRALRAVVFVGAHGTGANAFATPRRMHRDTTANASRHRGKCIATPRQMHRDTTANASRPCGALLQGGALRAVVFVGAHGTGANAFATPRRMHRDTAANASRHHGKCIAPLRCAPTRGARCGRWFL